MNPIVVVQTVIRYLGSHKRLVVPQLGVFIVKTPGESVVFSELFRHDDGVLRGLLCAGGTNELEAAGAIDRFVFEVRHALQKGGDYVMPGFGVLQTGPNGTVLFTYDPGAYVKPEPQPSDVSLPDPKISRSPKLYPDPSVRGLRYGKPEKVGGPYRHPAPRRRGVDKLVLFAIVASIIALATIAYVYIRDSRSEGVELDPMTTEQPAPDTDPAAVPEQTPVQPE